jgi:soluble lytic murein transglycosylase-like protein
VRRPISSATVLPAGAATVLTLLFALVSGSPAAHAQARWTREALVGKPYQKLIERVADRHQLDRCLLAALVEVESARRADAVSPKGARGLGQLMPATAERFGVGDIHDPEENLDGAARYLSWLLDRYSGNLRLALAAYNAGEGVVDRRGTVPDFPETVGFVQKVMAKAGRPRDVPRQAREDGPERVRVERGADGKIFVTNFP